jgi:hypothetical protein
MRIECWIRKGTNTHYKCVKLIAFQLQQWLYELIRLASGQLVASAALPPGKAPFCIE